MTSPQPQQPGRIARCKLGHEEPTEAAHKTKCRHVFTEAEAGQARGIGKAPGDKCRLPANVPAHIRNPRPPAPGPGERGQLPAAGPEDAGQLARAWQAEGPPAHWREILGEEAPGSEPCGPGDLCGCGSPPIRYTGDHTGTACPDCGPDCWDVSPTAARRAQEHTEAVKRHAAATATASAIVPQEEIDAQARALARARRQLARQVARVQADQRITDDTRDDLEWFAEAIAAAPSLERLEQLARQLAGLEIRRRSWLRRSADLADYEEEDQAEEDSPGDVVPGEILTSSQPGQLAEADRARALLELTQRQARALPGPAPLALPAGSGARVIQMPAAGHAPVAWRSCELCAREQRRRPDGRYPPAILRAEADDPQWMIRVYGSAMLELCGPHYVAAYRASGAGLAEATGRLRIAERFDPAAVTRMLAAARTVPVMRAGQVAYLPEWSA